MSAFIVVAISKTLETSLYSLSKVGPFHFVSPQPKLQIALQPLVKGKSLIALVDEKTGDTAHSVVMNENVPVKDRLAGISEAIDVIINICKGTGFMFFIMNGIPFVDDIFITRSVSIFEKTLADAIENYEVPDICLDQTYVTE